MQLDQWATRHNVTPEALDELRVLFVAPVTEPTVNMSGASEAAVSNAVRLEASQVGARCFRNNVGACQDKQGRLIRYGLANDSAAMNKVIKSSDLIGIRPVVITQDMVGCTIGQFVAREVKRADWKYKGTEREVAQLRFLELIVSLGGDACFANGVGTL